MGSYEQLLHHVEMISDISGHLFALNGYARGCSHITEMGVRDVVSTWAFLDARPQRMICIDINRSPNIDKAIEVAHQQNTQLEFWERSTTDPSLEIKETDFLFIDTLHNYAQLKMELTLHGNKSQKYLAFHDTVTYGYKDEQPVSNSSSQPRGLIAAIEEFLQDNKHWKLANHFIHNNGLTILRRK